MSVADLSVFDQKMTWEQRRKLISERFPALDTFDWEAAFKDDVYLLARMLRDILKLDVAEPGRPGPRPAIDYDIGMKKLRQLLGDDFSISPFHQAFTILIGTRSMSSIANRTGLSRSQVHRLRRGDVVPTREEMAKVAEAFDKHPSDFVEYRADVVVGALREKMLGSPESTIGFHRKVSDAS